MRILYYTGPETLYCQYILKIYRCYCAFCTVAYIYELYAIKSLLTMTRHVFLVLSILITFTAFSQQRDKSSFAFTSQAIVLASESWKVDTIGKLGLRARAFDAIRYSKVDTVTKTHLFKTLGNPNQVSKFYSGNTKKNYVSYIYYTMCMNDYPKDKPYWGGYIRFVFDEDEQLLVYIEDGDFCG